MANSNKINALTLLLTSALAIWDWLLGDRSFVCDKEKNCFFGTTDAGRGWLRALITCRTVNETEQILCFEFGLIMIIVLQDVKKSVVTKQCID